MRRSCAGRAPLGFQHRPLLDPMGEATTGAVGAPPIVSEALRGCLQAADSRRLGDEIHSRPLNGDVQPKADYFLTPMVTRYW